MIETRFKDTEIGKIPEEWEVGKIGNLCSINTGSKNTEDKDDEGKYPFYVRSQKIEHIDTFSYDCEAVLTAGDGVGTGKVFHYVNGKFDVHQRVYVMNDFCQCLYPKYFYWQFSENFYSRVKSMTAKSSVDSVRKGMIADMQIALPPFSEQRRIAKSLSNVDALIAAVEKKIEKKKLIKQGAMQQLLTGKRKLPGYKGEWVEKRLGEVGKLDRNSINPKLEPNKIFYEYSMPAYDIGRQPIKCLGDTMNSNRFIVKGEMLLFNKLNVRQKRIWLIDPHNDNSVCSQEFLPFTSTKVCLEYIAQLVATDWVTDAFIEKSKGTSNSQKRISPNDFLDYEISIPSDPSEQRAIASILSNMDSEITALERKRDKLKELKQGMMQQLLTGKIRLVRCSG